MTDLENTSHNSHHQHHHHHHQHSHEGDHRDGDESFTERNRAHWDKQAATYNSSEFQQRFGDLINKITAFIHHHISWIGVDFLSPSSEFEQKDPHTSTSSTPTHQVRVLDYACGPGTITNALTGYASEFVGIDLSDKMVEQYNTRFADDSSVNAHAHVGDLLSKSSSLTQSTSQFSSSQFSNFDLVAIGLGYHHFEDLERCTSTLVSRLRPGGIFLIVDFLTHKHNDLGDDTVHIIAHNGFDDDMIRKLFGGAGLVDVKMEVMEGEVTLKGTAKRTVFMARGRKSA